MTTQITFLGATDTVTGSRYLVESEGARILVDCGLFQGYKKLRERNWQSMPFDVSSLDAVVLTHAHIDHTGYLPRLCAKGYRGPVFCTVGTKELLGVLLPDSGYLHEEDARRANRRGYSRHRPALPLYTREDAERCLPQLRAQAFESSFEVAAGVSVCFRRAGHILGSATVAMKTRDCTLTFTGDVGRPNDPVMRPPVPLSDTDVLVTESTYGDRRHGGVDAEPAIADAINASVERGGALLIPAFAVGRAQHLLHIVARLQRAGRTPELPVFLDSPMAISATGIFCRHGEDHKLSDQECRQMCAVAEYARTPEQSKAIDRRTGAMILISASGMLTGGRVLHHLRRFLPHEENAILFVGYQAAGTRGRALLDGTDEIKVHGQYVPVRARVHRVPALSAHADYREMIDWFQAGGIHPDRVFVTHGEPAAADAFRRRLRDTFGWDVVVPDDKTRWRLA